MNSLHIPLSLFWVGDRIKNIKPEKFELQNKLSSIDSFLRMLVAGKKIYLEPENLAGIRKHQFYFFLGDIKKRHGVCYYRLPYGGGARQARMWRSRKLIIKSSLWKGAFHNECWGTWSMQLMLKTTHSHHGGKDWCPYPTQGVLIIIWEKATPQNKATRDSSPRAHPKRNNSLL